MTSNATTPAATNKNQELDQAFARRIHTSILTAQAWDDDPSLLFECRAMLPWEELQNETGKYAEPDKDRLRFANNRNIRFLQRLARFFQRDFMTWVNQPPCVACQGKNVKYQCTRGPETLEEKQGGASRVEVYQCQDCADETTTTFPRYNVPRKLLETRRGRCGEYANLFGCMCRAVGFDTRYISDFTDHVWTEVRVVHEGVEQWIMVDSCEGVVNEPSVSVLEQDDIGMKKKSIGVLLMIQTAVDWIFTNNIFAIADVRSRMGQETKLCLGYPCQSLHGCHLAVYPSRSHRRVYDTTQRTCLV